MTYGLLSDTVEVMRVLHATAVHRREGTTVLLEMFCARARLQD
jgi:hypothetical protein